MEQIKEMIEKVVSKLKEDKSLLASFKSEPIKVIEKLLGVDLPDEAIEKIIDGVKAKMSIDDAKDKLDDAKDAIEDAKNLFGGLMNKFKK